MATPPTLASGGGNTLGTGWCAASWVTTVAQTASITTQVGDVVVLGCMAEAAAGTFATPTNTGTAETWTLQTNNTLNGSTGIYTAIATAAQTTTVTVTSNLSGQDWGFEFWVWRGSAGIGVKSSTNMLTAAQKGNTFTGSNSAGIIIASDSNAGSTAPTWLTVNGSAMTTAAFLSVSSHYCVFAGHRTDCGAAGSITLGMSAPAGAFGVSTIEILGSAGGAVGLPELVMAPRPN